MRSNRNIALSLAVILLAALSIGLLAFETSRRQDEIPTTAPAQVFITGDEQAIINSSMGQRTDASAQRFTNSLDHAFAVLAARACPRPESQQLARATVMSLCEQFERETGNRIGTARREAWVSTIRRTKHFDSMVEDIVRPAPEERSRQRLIAAGLRGMLRATGWNSASVLTGPQLDEIKKIMEARETPAKEQGMLGLNLDRWPVVEVLPDAPAAEAGLRNGDILIAANGIKTTELKTAVDACKTLTGSAGEKVSLTVRRGKQVLHFEVRRSSAAAVMIKMKRVAQGIVYLKIPSFEGSGIADKVAKMIRRYVADGAEFVVLDLRDNAGGRPEEANGVANVLLDNKLLQLFEFLEGKRIAFKSNPGAIDVGIILLTNKKTGSAAEMLVMALRDNDRAVVIGERTAGCVFGKDTAELVGGETILFRTEPTVLSPRGTDYSSTGIVADIVVSDSAASGKDEICARAIEFARTKTGTGTGSKLRSKGLSDSGAPTLHLHHRSWYNTADGNGLPENLDRRMTSSSGKVDR